MHFFIASLLALTISPGEKLELFLAAPHGLSAAQLGEAEIACADPSGKQVLEKWADPSRLQPDKAPLDSFKARNAFLLLATRCGTKGSDEVVSKLRDVRTERVDTWLQLKARVDPKKPTPNATSAALLKHYEDLIVVERQGLRTFAAKHDKALVADLLPRVQTDELLQLDMVAYFTAVAPRDPAVKNELVQLRGNTKSQLLIDAIDAWLKL